MIRLTFASAAIVAGLTTLASHAQEAPATPDRAALEAAFSAKGAPAAEPGETANDGVDPITTASMPARAKPVLEARQRTPAKAGKPKPAADAEAGPVAAARETGKGGNTKFTTIISHYASSYGVPVSLAHAVVRVESNFRPDARGRAGEIGLMQIKPSTARMMGYSGSVKGLFHPETNIKYGMKYLAQAHKLGGGSTCGTILKYNAGHGAKRMNKVSAAYCAKVKRQIGG